MGSPRRGSILRTLRALLPVAVFLVVVPAVAQTPTPGHTTGLSMTKSCPAVAPPSTVIMCTFSIQNQDPQHGVINLAVSNTVPFPGGTTSAVPCTQGGMAVTTLGAFMSATDTCTGSVDETTPACGATDI